MKLSRRRFLGTAGAAAATLPLLRAMPTAAGPMVYPKRLIIVFTANGTIHGSWTPTGSETAWSLSPILAPLERHKSRLLVLDGVNVQSGFNGPGDDHQRGMGHLLTGTELLAGDEFPGCGGECAGSGWGGGISVDQFIADRVGNATPLRSLELGVQSGSYGSIWNRMAYRSADQPIPPEDSPYRAFERLFADFTTDTTELDRLREQRRSVIDTVYGDFTSLRGRLGSDDRQKLDAHLEAVRDIERRLGNRGGLGASCAVPDLGGMINVDDNDNFPAVGRLQMDLLTMALACDLTRVVSLQWSGAVSQTRHSWLGIGEGHHDLSHEGDSNAMTQDKLVQINTWYAEQFAYLLDRLSGVPEGDGTMLDHSIVVWGNELGKGNEHSHTLVPFVLAGSADNYFRTGRLLRYEGAAHSNLLVSLCNAMGVETSSFGNPAYCSGPLPNLR